MVCFTRSKYGRSGGIWGMFPVVLVERLLLGRTAVLVPPGRSIHIGAIFLERRVQSGRSCTHALAVAARFPIS